jgi:hypothetical protein
VQHQNGRLSEDSKRCNRSTFFIFFFIFLKDTYRTSYRWKWFGLQTLSTTRLDLRRRIPSFRREDSEVNSCFHPLVISSSFHYLIIIFSSLFLFLFSCLFFFLISFFHLQRFCDCFRNKLKMELRVFIDGSFESSKLETILERRKQTMRHCKSSWSHLPADLFPNYHPPSPSPSPSPSPLSSSTSSSSSGVVSKGEESQYQSFPPWFMSVFVKTLQENGVEVFMCSKEGDYELMQFYHWAKVNHFSPSFRPPLSSPSTPVTWAVLAQDTDYLMFPDLDYYFPLSEFNWESINLKVDKKQQQQQQRQQQQQPNQMKKKKKRKGKCVSSPSSPVPPARPSATPSPPPLVECKPPQYRLNCLRFSASLTANAFKIQRSMLPLFATLLGNDHTNNIVEEYKLNQLAVNSRRPSGASRRFESIMALSSYISQSYPSTRKNSKKNGRRTIDLFEVTKQLSRKVGPFLSLFLLLLSLAI